MATDIDNLYAARSAILAALAANAGQPNYTIDGETISWDSLTDRLEMLNKQIAVFEGSTEVATEYR